MTIFLKIFFPIKVGEGAYVYFFWNVVNNFRMVSGIMGFIPRVCYIKTIERILADLLYNYFWVKISPVYRPRTYTLSFMGEINDTSNFFQLSINWYTRAYFTRVLLTLARVSRPYYYAKHTRTVKYFQFFCIAWFYNIYDNDFIPLMFLDC